MKIISKISIFALVLVLTVACGGSGGGRGTNDNAQNSSTYTVIFNSNGGSPVSPETVNSGDTIKEPISIKLGYEFVDWYTCENFATKYIFSEPVTEKMTLYAKWKFNNSFKPGDTGPGGGIIFYVESNPNGFTMTDTGETCYYLEAKGGTDLVGTMKWTSASIAPCPRTGAIGVDIGTGRNNTKIILDPKNDPTAPAAKACDDYIDPITGVDDWFLPSRDELLQLQQKQDLVGDFGLALWSSSEGDSDNACCVLFTIPGVSILYDKISPQCSVRPIRAF